MLIHEDYMLQAINLAKKGYGNVSPNPLVGCVIVKNNKIIGEGYHQEYGKEHAEVNALNNCSESPIDADLYVNLEPCSIFQKTPPCVDQIISNSIKNVFIGTRDKNSLINGKGIEKLKISGINVFEGVLEKECYELNKGFFNWISLKRPWVIVKLAESKNGYLGIDSDSQTYITGDDSNIHTHKLRSEVDAILIGRKTAEVDNPLLTVRNILGKNPKRIIADTYRKLPLTLKLFKDDSAENIILCSNEKFEKSSTTFCNYLPIKENNSLLDPESILEELGKIGITSLLIEGGAKLVDSFFNKNLVDEIFLYTSNKVLENATLKNPIIIDEELWQETNSVSFNNDNLKVIRKKELCFQE